MNVQKTFVEMIDERLESIELAVTWIADAATDGDLRDLRVLLVDVTGLLRRDPGVEAAADDLFGAARAIVKDRPLGLQPVFRKQRLLKEANLRLRVQLHAAARRAGATEHFELPGLAAIYAAHLALRADLIHVSEAITRAP